MKEKILFPRLKCDANTPCSIQDGKDPEFWPESMSPFYTLPTGARSCYNHVVMAGLQVDQFNLALLLLVVVSEFEFAINLFLYVNNTGFCRGRRRSRAWCLQSSSQVDVSTYFTYIYSTYMDPYILHLYPYIWPSVSSNNVPSSVKWHISCELKVNRFISLNQENLWRRNCLAGGIG